VPLANLRIKYRRTTPSQIVCQSAFFFFDFVFLRQAQAIAILYKTRNIAVKPTG